MTTYTDDWAGCYDNGWKGLITDAAFSHPAKFSHGLIRRIYQHLLDEALVKPGDTILDPFGGVGLGAIYALQNGLNWVGVELEQKFVELGQANIDLWNTRYAAHFPRWGSARLLQGDSRRLAEIVAGAGCVVSSPPYADGANHTGGNDPNPQFIQGGKRGAYGVDGYGQTPGQLASLPPGSIDFVISSPPFAGNTGGRGEASRNGIDAALFDRHSGGMKRGTGGDPANLDNLRMGPVVGSPPFHDSLNNKPSQQILNGSGGRMGESCKSDEFYGSTSGQLGAMKSGESTEPETFWTAARTILEQCALLLPPGAPAVWVVKNYIKGGREVDFSGQWQALCEACGFETVHIHRAWLIKNRGTKQATMDGDSISKEVARKSFFRRLAEAKGSPAIDFEDVICTVRSPQC